MLKKRRLYIICFLSFIVIVYIFVRYQNNTIVVSEYIYQSGEIPSEMDEYCILQISDLHNKSFGKNNKNLISKIEKENPDMIVITGDLIDSKNTDIGVAVDFAKEIVKIAPVYYVTGNHEYWLTVEEQFDLNAQLEAAGVIMLDDNYVNVMDAFYLCGVSDHTLRENWSELVEMSTELPDNSFKLLLAHEPQYIEKYAIEKYDIVLSGHAHGGQFRIPFTQKGIIAPDQGFFPEYTSGEHLVDSTTMYVSRGLGNSIVPLRVFNRPELIKVVLKN